MALHVFFLSPAFFVLLVKDALKAWAKGLDGEESFLFTIGRFVVLQRIRVVHSLL